MKYLLIAAIAATSMFAVTAPASAATVSCTAPNSIKCKVTSNKGLKSVWVKSTQGFGTLASKNFNNCPKVATISWDSAYHGDVKYKECKGKGFAPVGSAPQRVKPSQNFGLSG